MSVEDNDYVYVLTKTNGRVIKGGISATTFYNSLDSDISQMFEPEEFDTLYFRKGLGK